MNIKEFNNKFEGNQNFLIAINALFYNRNVNETNSSVYVEMTTQIDHLSNYINTEKEQGSSCVYALPSSFLSEEKTNNIRKELIERDLLDTIILIPSYWLDNANEDIALLYLNTINRQKGVVKFIDITYDSGSDITPYGFSIINLIKYDAFPNYKNLIGNIDEEQMDLLADYFDEFICVVGHYEIVIKDYSLVPACYIKRIQSFNGYHLYELWNIVEKKVKNAKGKIIRDYDLKDSASHYEIDVYSIELSEGYGDHYVLNGRYVLVAKKGELRPTLVDTKGYTIYVPCEDIVAIDNDEEDLLNDYVISELRKPHVEWQRKKWQDGLVSWLRVHVPDDTNEKSSIDLQRESFVQSKFYDVCGYCKHSDLLYLMAKVENEEIKCDASVPNKIRNVMESYVLPLLYKNGIRPIEKVNGNVPNSKTNISGYSKALPLNTPEYIKRSFHTISRLVQAGSHDYDDTKIQKNIREGLSPYLTTSLVYDLFNVIVWCKKFENKPI